MADKTLEQISISGKDAQALLNNPILKEAFEKMGENLERRIQGCNVITSPNSAADIIRCKQLLGAIKREIYNIIQNGEVAEIQLKELDKKKFAVFNRGY